MATITLRNLDESLKASLRMNAAANSRSMEEEVRQILKRHLLRERCKKGVGSRIANRFSKVGGIDLPKVSRSYPRGVSDGFVDETNGETTA
ncbi:plasmid stabilization protein [Desulfosarcina widdelii]|uniref:Plasmid stabilization protein n=1 Tax=Desulfosarcina widdelii TaxID=947919 RepID=A0A5K7YTY4_9BACT|nr:plasmid stabilization protein [Desulfosarcina widdelii]BBO72806.1 plasmid stabilization protein [Desulfosarcina widdelii]